MAPEQREKREAFRKWFMFWATVLCVPGYGAALFMIDSRTEQTIRKMDYINRVEWNAKWDAHDREVRVILDGLKQSSEMQLARISSMESNRDLLNGLAVKVARVEATVDDIRESVRQLMSEKRYKGAD